MIGELQKPRKILKDDIRKPFDCGVHSLNLWLHNYSFQNLKKNNAVTYVSVIEKRVVGYYCLSAGGVSLEHAPQSFARGRPNQIPVIVLGRLAVDKKMMGHGLRAALLADAIRRVVYLSDEVGIAGLVIHCIDEITKNFYFSNGDFLTSPVDSMQLILPMAAAKTLTE